jgi:uncharacterized protein (DUF1330 family)
MGVTVLWPPSIGFKGAESRAKLRKEATRRSDTRHRSNFMTKFVDMAFALTIGIVLGGAGLSVLHAQTKVTPAYWVTEVIEMQDQAAFMKGIPAVSQTVPKFGGRYIVLGGKLAADVGPEPKRITIIAFDSMDKAQAWLHDPTATAARDAIKKYAKTRSYTVEGTGN